MYQNKFASNRPESRAGDVFSSLHLSAAAVPPPQEHPFRHLLHASLYLISSKLCYFGWPVSVICRILVSTAADWSKRACSLRVGIGVECGRSSLRLWPITVWSMDERKNTRGGGIFSRLLLAPLPFLFLPLPLSLRVVLFYASSGSLAVLLQLKTIWMKSKDMNLTEDELTDHSLYDWGLDPSFFGQCAVVALWSKLIETGSVPFASSTVPIDVH